ncbi:Mutatorlike transposase, partial [Globisporangium splendens]
MVTSPASKSAAPTSELLDELSNADIARLVNEAAQGRLKSAKALRDALMLPVTIQKVQQILSSDEFHAKVKLAAKATAASDDNTGTSASAAIDDDSNKCSTRSSSQSTTEKNDEEDEDGDGDEDEPMGEKDIDSDDDNDNDEDEDEDEDEDMEETDDDAPITRGKTSSKRKRASSANEGSSEAAGDDDGEDSASEGDEDATTTPGGRPRNAKDNDKKRRPRSATVTKADGTQLTISEGQVFKDRALVKSVVREFAAAQGKSVLIHRKTNGGNNFMYVCKSQTPCDFYVKIRRTNRKSTAVHVISSSKFDHGPECTGKPPNPRRQPKSQTSLLPAKSATVTMKDGVTLTLRERQEFATREQLKDFIHDFALAQEKRARVDRLSSGGNNITFVCTSQTKCNFKVRSLRSKRTGRHYIKSFEAEHGEECTGKPSVTKRQVLNHLKRLQTGPTLALSGPDVQAIVKSMQGVDVTSRVAADARYELVGKVLKDAMVGIQKLESLLTQFQSLNPTASVQVEIAPDNTFKRAFLKLPYSNQVQAHGARVLGLSTVQMGPSSNFQGIMFELVVKDGNNHTCVIAVALCDGKNPENYTWFFNCCAMAGISLNAPMLCDRNSAILIAVESLPISFTLIQCTQSLLANIEEKMPLPSNVRALVLRAQASETEKEFKASIAAIGEVSAPVADYLKNTDPNTWAKYCFLQRYSLFGCHSAALTLQTTAETASSSTPVSSPRDLSPFEFFQHYMERCMKSVYEGKRQAKNWMNSGRNLTAYAEKVLKDHESEAMSCHVVPSDDEKGVAYIWDVRSATPKKRRVNLSMNSCTCSFLDQCALPCKHLVAAVTFFNADGASWNLSQLCHPMYSAVSYFEVYGQVNPIDIPVEEELVRNLTIKIAPGAISNRCSLCHEIGHNKRRCKLASGNAPPPAAAPVEQPASSTAPVTTVLL